MAQLFKNINPIFTNSESLISHTLAQRSSYQNSCIILNCVIKCIHLWLWHSQYKCFTALYFCAGHSVCAARPSVMGGSCPSSECSPQCSPGLAEYISALLRSQPARNWRNYESDEAEKHNVMKDQICFWSRPTDESSLLFVVFIICIKTPIPTSASISLVEYWLVTPTTMCAIECEPRSNL